MRSSIASRLALVSFASLASFSSLACERGAESERGPLASIGSTEQAIQGGQSTGSKYPFVFGMIAEVSGGAGICTGTLIAPNLILTARHCVSDTSTEYIDCETTRFTTNTSASRLAVTPDPELAQNSDFYSVSKVILPTDDTMCGHDVALLILSENVPESVATPAIPRIHEKVTAGTGVQAITAIGYGTIDNESGSGTRRIRENIELLCAYDHPDRDKDCNGIDAQQQAALLTESDIITSVGTCQGDSGSSAFEQSAFDDGKYYSIGVLSRGDSRSCDIGVYTRVDAFKDLIISAATEAAEAGGYTPPAWIAGPDEPPPTGSSSGGSQKGGLGATCAENVDCASDICFETSDKVVCTIECTDDESCGDDGFTCNGGYCFAAQAATTSSSSGSAKAKKDPASGCSVSADPTKPIPWRSGTPMAGLALGVALLLRRRSSR